MANIPPIQFKRSHTASVIPAPSQLAVGEIALNFVDQAIYTKDSDGNIIAIGSATSSGLFAVDSEKVLSGLDSDKLKHKESVVYLIEEKKLVNWDSETDKWEPIQLGSGGGDTYEDFELTTTENPILNITEPDMLAITDSEQFIVLFESFALPREAYKMLNDTGSWAVLLKGGRDSETAFIGETWAVGDKIRVTTTYTVNNAEKILGYATIRDLNPLVTKFTSDSDIPQVIYVDTLANPWQYNTARLNGAINGGDLSDSDTNTYFFENSTQPTFVANGPFNQVNNGYIYYTGARVNSSKYYKERAIIGFDMSKAGQYTYRIPAGVQGPFYMIGVGGGASGGRGKFGGSGGCGGSLTISQASTLQVSDIINVTVGAGGPAPRDSDMDGFNGGNTRISIGSSEIIASGGRHGVKADTDVEVSSTQSNPDSKGSIMIWGGESGNGNPTTPTNANGENGYVFTYRRETYCAGAGGAGGLTDLVTVTDNEYRQTKPGIHTFDIPLNAFNVRVIAVGGGGSGGSGAASGAGGGGGGIVGTTLPTGYAGTTITFEVGDGGAALDPGSTQESGNRGKPSLVHLQDGSMLIALGGAGGTAAANSTLTCIGGIGGDADTTGTRTGIEFNSGGLGGTGGGNASSGSAEYKGRDGNTITVGGITYRAGGGGGGGAQDDWSGGGNIGGSVGGGTGGTNTTSPVGKDGTTGTGGGGGGGGEAAYRPGSGAGGSGWVAIVYDLYKSAVADIRGGSAGFFGIIQNAGGSPSSRVSPYSFFPAGNGVDGTGSGGGGGGLNNSPAGAGGSGRAVIIWTRYEPIEFDIKEFYKIPVATRNEIFVKTEDSGRINYAKMEALSEMSAAFAATTYNLEPSKVFRGTPAPGAEMRYFIDNGVGNWQYDSIEIDIADNTSVAIDDRVELGWDTTNGFYWKNVYGKTLGITDRITGRYRSISNSLTHQQESTVTRYLSDNATVTIFPLIGINQSGNNGVILKLRSSISDLTALQYARIYETNLVHDLINNTRKITVRRLK